LGGHLNKISTRAAWQVATNRRLHPADVVSRKKKEDDYGFRSISRLPGELDAVSQTIAAMMDGRFVALNITKRALDLFFHWFSHPDARVP